MACAAPLDPTGYIGCAASPISVTRPVPHAVSGSRSHIGYSKNSGVASINASTLRSGSLKFFAYGYARPIVPRRDQLSRSGGGLMPFETSPQRTQLVSIVPGFAPRAIG